MGSAGRRGRVASVDGVSSTHSIPVLEGVAADAVAHRGGHIQIIAAAGSGKTEVVSQRIAALLVDGEPPESIVAFTFTEKAAIELKERIRLRAEARLGAEVANTLGKLFVGTIHAYCLRLLQTYVARYEGYTPLDENQLFNLIYREASRIGVKALAGGTFDSIKLFLRGVDVVENELLSLDRLPDGDFRTSLGRYYTMLDQYQFMSFGMQIARAVDELRRPDVHAAVSATLKHLIVDEYQDVNPAQEELIRLLAAPTGLADLVVVGDDDQAIYQWRGSDVRGIVTFASRYPDVTQFELLQNRRSRPAIVEAANAFAQSIPGRLPKQMVPFRHAVGDAVTVAVGVETEEKEAQQLAVTIKRLHAQGVPYRDIAILVRARTAYPAILKSLDQLKIPVEPGGRSRLFERPEAALFGATYAWIAGTDWRAGRYTARGPVDFADLKTGYKDFFELTDDELGVVVAHLFRWKDKIPERDFDVSLVGDFYKLLALVNVSRWDLTDEFTRARLGTIGRFTQVLADYELTRRRARRDPENPGEQLAGEYGGEWFYRNLAIILLNYAQGGYDDFDGEESFDGDGVALGTIHGSKGLEWPVVFLPSLTAKRFPITFSGQQQEWPLPRNLFAAERYEGGDEDERRLFYVALTRARDWVSLSSHARITKQLVRPSDYITEVQALGLSGALPQADQVDQRNIEAPDLSLTYSELASYIDCPAAYLLRTRLGFMPPIAEELGYGNAVHHFMRLIAEHARVHGHVPDAATIDTLFNSDFYLPFANKAAAKEMKARARTLVDRYVSDHTGDLLRTWATEYPFELYLDGVIVRGRADVIYDEVDDGSISRLTLVDYKTATGIGSPLQLQVYAEAGLREGLAVDHAFIEDMSAAVRHVVDVSPGSLTSAQEAVLASSAALRAGDFTARPERAKCDRCDVRRICAASASKRR